MKVVGELYMGTKVTFSKRGQPVTGTVVGRTSLKEYLACLEESVREVELARIQSEYGSECHGFVVYHVEVEDSINPVESGRCEAVDEKRDDTTPDFV